MPDRIGRARSSGTHRLATTQVVTMRNAMKKWRMMPRNAVGTPPENDARPRRPAAMLWKMRVGLAPRRPKKMSASARSRTPTASVPNRIARLTASSYPTHPGDAARRGARQNRRMSNTTLLALSNELSTLVDGAAPSVVQVQGRRRTASGVALGDDAVLTMVRAIGRDETLRIRRHDDQTIDAELVGWDPATGLAVLRAPGLGVAAARHSDAPVRVGHLAVAV